jgi:hypothetical protein
MESFWQHKITFVNQPLKCPKNPFGDWSFTPIKILLDVNDWAKFGNNKNQVNVLQYSNFQFNNKISGKSVKL